MSINNKFNFDQVTEKFENLEIKELECLFIASNLGKIGLIPGHDRKYLLETIFNSLRKINPELTIVVPTATLNLVNSKNTFDLKNTPSDKMGPFSEYVRQLNTSLRSFHAIWSLAANGPLAEFITKDISRHAYDKNSAFSRLFKIKKSSFLALGQHPRFMLSIIHHFENICNVPYRFKKEFTINCKVGEELKNEIFILDVMKNHLPNNLRTKNKKIFENFEKKGNLFQTSLGKGKMYYFDMNEFYSITKKLFEDDINCWLK